MDTLITFAIGWELLPNLRFQLEKFVPSSKRQKKWPS
jgi:hypothetical protein